MENMDRMCNLHIEGIQLDYAPRKKVLPIISFIESEPEMTEFESAFLAGLISEYKPKKCLEVGVAAGGTTAIMLQALTDINNQDFVLHSVDLCERFYRGEFIQTGKLGDEAAKNLNLENNWILKLGNSLPFFIEEIGDGIEFAILDTMHSLPGELLDFIVLLPYLKDGAVVCLHDISYNQVCYESRYGNACNVLYNVVTADKIFNFVPDLESDEDYPNIGAFIVNCDTRKYAMDLFRALSLTWEYPLNENEKNKYYEVVEKKYSKDAIHVLSNALFMNDRLFERKDIEEKRKNTKLPFVKRIRKMAKLAIKGYY